MKESKLRLNQRILTVVLLVGLLLAMGWLFQNILSYLLIALILSAVLRTPTNYIGSIQVYGVRLPRGLAILASFTLLFGILALFVYLFVPLVSEQIKVISNINFKDVLNRLSMPLAEVENFFIQNQFTDESPGFLRDALINNMSTVLQRIQVTSFLNDLLQFTGSFFVGLMAVLFITFFFLYEPTTFRRYFISLIPNRYFEVSIAAVSKTEKLLSNYLLGLSLQMSSVFSLAALGLLISGVDYAISIAVFAAIANLIPYLGPILGAIFGLIVGLSTNPDLVSLQDYIILSIKIISVFGMVQLSDNVILQPIIFSKSVKTHPLVIFLAVFVGSALAGIFGMIMAIPAFTIIRVIFGEFYKGYKEYQIFRN